MTTTQKQHEIASQLRSQFVEAVRELAMKHYEVGGDQIVECMSDDDILEQFLDLNAVREWCEVRHEVRLEQESTIW